MNIYKDIKLTTNKDKVRSIFNNSKELEFEHIFNTSNNDCEAFILIRGSIENKYYQVTTQFNNKQYNAYITRQEAKNFINNLR